MALDVLSTNFSPWGDVVLGHEGVEIVLPDSTVLQLRRESQLVWSRLIDPDFSTGDEAYDVLVLEEEGLYSVAPILPDRPLVLRPAHSLSILAGGFLKTMVHVPLFPSLVVRIGEKERTVREWALPPLSKTWFGDPVEGEAAYSLSAPLDEKGMLSDPDPWIALCPLIIRNESPDILDFERMILRVPFLSLYGGKQRIYTNELTVRFRGVDQVSQVQISTRFPEVGEPVRKLSDPRSRSDWRLLRKSFSFIKSLYSM